jgi:dolichyl-phosphate-mannose-protein mannosyltransferase
VCSALLKTAPPLVLERPAPTPARRHWPGWLADPLLLLVLGGVAALVRWPEHALLPPFSDEVYDVQVGYLIGQGRLQPLVDPISRYNGSLWDWLLAGALRLSQNDPTAPRALIALAGVAMVLAVYPLGRAWGGRLAGLVAGLLLATCAIHVVVNSHLAWSNCLTPLFTSLGIWWLSRGLAGPRPVGRWLAASGLAWGLALQTHPSAAGLLPGAAAYLAWRSRGRLPWRWVALGGGLFLLANLNLIVYNLGSGGRSFSVATEQASRYSQYEPLSLALYLGHLRELALGLLQTLGGALTSHPTDLAALGDPVVWLIALVVAAGLVWQARRGNPLPLLLLVSELAVLPLFNRRFHALPDGRYYMPLLPPLYASAASLLGPALTGPGRAGLGRRLRQAGLVALTVGLIVHPLLSVQEFYRQLQRDGQTNAAFFSLVEQVKGARRGDSLVLLDSRLHESRTQLGGGEVEGILHLLLSLAEVPHRTVDLGSADLSAIQTSCRDQLIVLAPDSSQVRLTLVGLLRLREVSSARGEAHGPAHFFGGLYRVGARPAQCGR